MKMNTQTILCIFFCVNEPCVNDWLVFNDFMIMINWAIFTSHKMIKNTYSNR